MRVIRSPRLLQRMADRLRRAGKTVGFVPTMGALHEGHRSLIRRARRETDCVVVSIFVNPLQFHQRSDYARYPRPLARDAALARSAGVDILFIPGVRSLYPPDFQTTVDVTRLSRRWEGAFRPGHFRGVATVVAKLFNVVHPDLVYVGEKDAQQARLIQQLARDLNWGIRVRTMPTVREPDGLAMSSRNARLSPSERRRALVVVEALQAGRRLIECGERRRAVILRSMRGVMHRAPGTRLEYVAVVDPATLDPVDHVQGTARLLIAAWVGRVRLIDTVLVKARGS